MLNYHYKTRKDLIKELQELLQQYDSLKTSYEKDISECKLIKKELVESEESYRLLFENTGEAILSTNPDGSIYSANPKACGIFGMSEDEICKLGRTGVVDLNDPRLEPALNERRKTGKSKAELNLLRKDGTKFPAEVTSTIFRDTSGNERTSMIIRDISESQQIEKELRLQSEIMKNISEGINLVRLYDEVIVFTNAKFDEMFGYEHGELIGKQISIVNAPTDKSPIETKQDIIDTINRTGEWHGEILNIKKNGDHFWCYANVSMFDHPAYGKVLVSVHSDITERKLVEDALRESEEIFRYFMEYSPIYIFFSDKDIRSLRLSKNYETMLGKPLKELLGKNMNDLFPSVHAKKMVPDDRRILKEGKVITIKDELNGRFYSTIKFPILIKGKPRYLAGFTIDISERMHAEEEARKSKKLLEDLHKHLIEIRENEHTLIAREIHDQLGQSLTALKFDLTWLRQKITDESEESRKLNGMIELVNTVSMNVHRISSELRPVMLDDLGLAAALEWYCEEFANRTGLKVKMEIEDIQTENMDKNLSIYRVAQESLTNIIRHAGAKKVQIKLCKIKKDIVLIIQDDGIGISPDKISSTKSLGLLGMFERINQSGGQMEIIAPDKGGTKIRVYIPMK